MIQSHDLQRLLDFDPQQAARQAGGKKNQLLASALALEHHRRLRALLQEFDDSYLGQGFEGFCSLARGLGFRPLQREALWQGGEAWFIALEKDGMLLCADSYQGMTNQAQLLLRSRRPLVKAEAHGRIYRASLDVRCGLKTRLMGLEQPLACCLQTDHKLLPESLAERLTPKSWGRKARRALGAK